MNLPVSKSHTEVNAAVERVHPALMLSSASEVLIYDPNVESVDVLLAGLDPAVQPFAAHDGPEAVEHLRAALSDPRVLSIHLLAHGGPGIVRFGKDQLAAEDFAVPAHVIPARSHSLDIYFWSCRTGADMAGGTFVQKIAELSMAKVHASTGLVGNQDKGGSWELDVVREPTAKVPFSAQARSDFMGVMAVPTLSSVSVDSSARTVTFVFSGEVSAVSGVTLIDQIKESTDQSLFNTITNASAAIVSGELVLTYSQGNFPTSDLYYSLAASTVEATNGGDDNTAITTTQLQFGSMPALDSINEDSGADGDFVTNDQSLTLSGSYDSAATSLTVKVGETTYVSGTDTELNLNSTAGTWTLDLTGSTLAEQSYQVVVTSVIAGDNYVATQTLVIDTTEPTTTVAITSADDNVGSITTNLSDGDVTDDVSPTITGTLGGATEGAQLASDETLRVYDGATYLGEASVTVVTSGQSTWSYTDTRTLSDGATPSYTARVADAAGNEGLESAAFELTIDTTAPEISSVSLTSATGAQNSLLNAGDVVTATVTFDEAVIVTGTPQLTLDIGGSAVQADYADGTGTTDITFTYTILANQTDPDGISIAADSLALNSGSITDTAGNAAVLTHTAVSDDSSYKVDTTAPTAVLSAATDDVGTVTGALSSGDATDDTSLVLSGTNESGSTVEVFDGTTSLGQATVDGTTWSFTATVADGTTYDFNVKETDAAGNTSAATSDFVVVGDTTAPDAPTIDAVSTDNLINDTESTGGFNLTGTGEAGATVTVTGFASSDKTATVQSNGTWSIAVADADLNDDATTTLTATQTDPAGNTSASATTDIEVDVSAPTITINTPLEGDNKVNASEDADVVVSGTTAGVEDGQTVTVTFDDDNNDVISKTATVTSNAWTLSGDQLADISGLDNGSITVEARVSDAAGNAANPVTTTITLDNVAPTISSMSATDATYEVGETVAITVTFSEAVTVDTTNGTPTLTLSNGETASYVSGSTTTELVFQYAVVEGQNDASDLDVMALNLSGGTIKDAAGNDATLTITDGTNDLATSNAVVVDANSPTINEGTVYAWQVNSTAEFTLTASETVTWSSGSLTNATLSVAGVLGLTAIPAAGGSVDYAVTATDTAGNATTKTVTVASVPFAVFNAADEYVSAHPTFDAALTAAVAGQTIKIADTDDDNVGTYAVTGSEAIDVDASLDSSDGVNLLGNTSDNILTGGSKADTLSGGEGADELIGNAGNDQLTGGAGADVLDGGAGNDTFVYNDPAELASDTLTGGSGTNTVELKAAGIYDFNLLTSSTGITNLSVEGATGPTTVIVGPLADADAPLEVSGNNLTQNVTIDASDLGAAQSVVIQASGFNGNDTFTGGAGTDQVVYTSTYSVDHLTFSGTGLTQTLNIANGSDGTDALNNIEVVEFASGVTVRLVGANAYANIAEAVTAADASDRLFLAEAAPISIETANSIASKTLGIDNASLTEVSDTATAISGANFGVAPFNAYATITNTSTGETATIGAAELGTRSVTLAGDGTFTVTGTIAEIQALSATTYGSIDNLVISDNADDISSLSTADIADLITRGVDEITINDGDSVEFTIAQTRAFAGDTQAAALTDTTVVNTVNGIKLPAFDYIASADDDLLTGTAGADSINAGLSDDVVNAGAGNDTIIGGAGNDTLNGEAGNDTLTGGSGNDTIDGGADIDTAIFSGTYDSYTFTRAAGDSSITVTGADGTDQVSNVEVLQFSDVDVRMVGVGGYASLADAVSAAGNGDVIHIAASQPVTLVDAEFIANKSLTFNKTVDTLADTAANLSSATLNMSASGYLRYDTIAITDGGTATMGASELGSRALTLTGTFEVTGSYNEVLNLHQATAISQIDTLTVSDSSATLQGLSATEISNIQLNLGASSARGVDAFIGTGDIYLTKAQMAAFSNDATSTNLTSGGTVIQVGDYLGAGNDNLTAVGTSDTGFGLSTQNSVSGIDGQVIDGRDGNDRISGSAASDQLIGGSGNDYLIGGNGDDVLEGGVGNDLYFVTSGDEVVEAAGAGTDEIRTDSLIFDLSVDGDNVENLRYVGDGDFTGTGNDLDNLIFGGAGADNLDGGLGADTLFGGAGADTLDGGAGDDTFIVGQDRRSGFYTGTETVTGSVSDYASDTIDGGADFDTLRFQGTADNQELFIHANTTNVEQFVLGDEFQNTTSSNDALDLNASGLVENSTAFNITLPDGTGTVSITGAEIIGNAGANTLVGSSFGDVIRGGGAEDALYGGAGDDYLFGESGNDQIFGGDGNDVINGGTGNDATFGEAGDDIFVATSGNDSFDGGSGGDTVVTAADATITATEDSRFEAVMSVQVTGTGVGTDSYTNVETINTGGALNVATDAAASVSNGTDYALDSSVRLFASDGTTLLNTYTSFSAAFGAATDGDVIVLADDSTHDLGSQSYTFNKEVTILGSGSDNAGLLENGTAILGKDGITIEGIRIAVADTSTALTISADNATIRDVSFVGNGISSSAVAIAVDDVAHNFTIESSDFSGLTTAISLPTNYAANGTILGNTLANSATALDVNGLTDAANLTVDANTFVGNTTAIDLSDTFTQNADISIDGNRFEVGNSADGINASTATLTAGGTFETGLASVEFNTFVLAANTAASGSTNNAGVAVKQSTDTSDADIPTGEGLVILGTGASNETAQFDQHDFGLTLDLSQTQAVDFNGDGDSIDDPLDGTYSVGAVGDTTVFVKDIENVTGTQYNDAITGDDQDNELQGRDGDDVLSGGGGNDTLDGGAGDDDLTGGDGDDLFLVGDGNNIIDGGAGDDTYDVVEVSGSENFYAGGDGDDTVEFTYALSEYFINRADHLLADVGGQDLFYNEFFDENAPSQEYTSTANFQVGEPIFQVDYIFADGTRQTDYVQAEFLVFEGGDSDPTNDITLIWGTLTELETDLGLGSGALLELVDGTLTGGEAAPLSIAANVDLSSIDFITSSDKDQPFTYNGGGFPTNLTDPNYVLGSLGNDTITGGDGADIILGRAGDDEITGGVGADDLDGGEGEDNYYITPQVWNTDGNVFVGDEFASGEVIADSGSTSDLDEVHIIDGGTVRFDLGTLTGVEDVLFDSYGGSEGDDGRLTEDSSFSSNSVYVTSSQFDGVDQFLADATVGGDYLEIEFETDDTSLSGTVVDGVNTLVLDSDGTNRLNAENVTKDATVYVRGSDETSTDAMQVDDLQADIYGFYSSSWSGVYAGTLDVNLQADAGEVFVYTGSGETSVTTRSGSTALINATKLSSDLNLDGVGAIEVQNAGSITIDGSNDLSGPGFDGDTSPLTGELEVTTKFNADVNLITGTNNTTLNSSGGDATVDATLLNDDLLLTLTGSSGVTVTELQGNVQATNSSGVLDITTAATVNDGEVTITTGTNNATVTGTTDGHTINVNADAMSTGDRLTVDGDADFVVTNVGSNVTVDADGAGGALAGTLDVTTDNAASGVTVLTGTEATTINTGLTTGGSVLVEAAELTNDTVLDLNGAARIRVDDLVGDVDATGMTSGSLRVNTSDNADDGDITVETGNTNVYVNTTSGDDTVNVDADRMAGSTELFLGGSSDVVVTNLVRDLDADGAIDGFDGTTIGELTGDLTVTTGALANDSGVQFTLGSGTTNITADEVDYGVGDGPGSDIDLTIDATALTANDLTLSGDAEVAVDVVSTDVDASSLTGGLDIDSAQGAIYTLTTGSGETRVSGATGSTVTVAAANLVSDGTLSGAEADAELIIDGTGTVVVNNLPGVDVNAAGFSGSSLTINTNALTGTGTGVDNEPAVEIVTGTTNTTINGTDSLNEKDIIDIRVDASALAGEVVGATNQVLSLEGTAEYFILNDTNDKTLFLDIASIADDNTVTLGGIGDFELTGTSADVDATALSGDITVRTKDGNSPDDDIIVRAGTGITTVDAIDSGDKITLEADLLLDDEADTDNDSGTDKTEVVVEGAGYVVVDDLKADLDASSFTGQLEITRGQITGDAIDDVDIILGSQGASVDLGQAINETYIDASNMAVASTLSLLGDGAEVKVDRVASGAVIDASGNNTTPLTGAMEVITLDGATNVDVVTGTAITSVTSDNGSVDIDATELSATMTLVGSSDFTVTELETNLVASATTGDVTITTAAITGVDATTPKLTVTAGSGNFTINGDDSVEGNTDILDIAVNANLLSDTDSDVDLVLTGDAEYFIVNNSTTGEVTIDASALENDGGLTLSGSGDFRLVNTTEDVQAPNLTGRLTVETDTGTPNIITVTAGSGFLGVDAKDSDDEITVEAQNLSDDEIDTNEQTQGNNSPTDAWELEAAGAGDVIVNDLDADLDAGQLQGALTANVTGGSDVDIRLNQAASTINTGTTNVTLDADEVASGETVVLNDSGDAYVFNAEDGITVDGGTNYTGELTVKTAALAANESLDVISSSAATTIIGQGGTVDVDATALADDIDLTIEGSSTVNVTDLQGDVVAGSSTGQLDITTVDQADLTIETGSADAFVTATGGAVAVDAGSMAANSTLTVDGAANVTVTEVGDDVTVDADDPLTGTLDVTTKDGATGVVVQTGSAVTDVSTGALASGEVVVEADEMLDDVLLTLDGASEVTVDALIGDVNASALTGDLRVNTADNTAGTGNDGEIEIEIGDATTTVVGGGSSDDILINATGMVTDGDRLILSGDSAVIVTGLVEDLDANGDAVENVSALAGGLTVTTGELANNAGLNIALGTNSATVNADETDTAPGVETDVTINAASMGSAQTLTLTGDAEVAVDGVRGTVDAESLTGGLDVDTATNSALTVLTGSGSTLVTAATGSDITVEADQLAVDSNTDSVTYELTVDGSGTMTVNDLSADLDANASSGVLSVNTTVDADVNIKTGSNNAFIDVNGANGSAQIDADPMGSGIRLSAFGEGAVDIVNVASGVIIDANGNTTLDQFALSGTLSVTTDVNATGVIVETGDAETTVDGSGGATTVRAAALDNDVTLNLLGSSAHTVEGLVGDVDASNSTGIIDISTSNNADDNDVSVATGSGQITVDANHVGDRVDINATALSDDTLLTTTGASAFNINNLKGDLNAGAGAGALTVSLSNTVDLAIQTARNATVDAASLSGSSILELTGAGDVTINNLLADIDANGVTGWNSGLALSGDLNITTLALAGTNSAPAMTITTGSGSTSVDGLDADINNTETVDILVDATAMSDTDVSTVLALEGTAEYRLVNTSATGEVQVNLTNGVDIGTVELTGLGAYNLIETSTDIDAGTAEGPITVTTRVGAGDTIEVIAGSNVLTVDAEHVDDVVTIEADELADDENDGEISGQTVSGNSTTDDYELTVEGAGSIIVNDLGADLDASTLTGDLSVGLLGGSVIQAATLADGGVAFDDVDIKLGSANIDINTRTSDVTDVTLDANAVLSGNTVTIGGGGAAEVFNVNDGVTVDAQTGLTGGIDMTGTLDVFTGALSAGEAVTVKTGSAQTKVVGDGSDLATVSVAADKLAQAAGTNNNDLVLLGTTAFVVTALNADLLAATTSGEIDVTTADDQTVGTLDLTTGSGDFTLSGADDLDTLNVNADELTSGATLVLDGSSDVLVTNVASGVTVDADGDGKGLILSGELTVSLDASATGNTVLTGNDNTTINTSAGGDVTVNATELADAKLLTLNGAAAATVTGLIGDVDASGLTGTLDVTTADNSDADAIAIELGSGQSTIDAYINDVVTIDAELQDDDDVLRLAGDGGFVVNNQQGDIDAGAGTGTLTASLQTPVDDTITVDTDRTTTVKAGELEAADTLVLAGSGDITVERTTDGSHASPDDTYGLRAQTLDASATSGSIVVKTAAIAGTGLTAADAYLDVVTGSGDFTIDADDATNATQTVTGDKALTVDVETSYDVQTIDVDIDSSNMAADDVLTLKGDAEYHLTDVNAIVRASTDGSMVEHEDDLQAFASSFDAIDKANFPTDLRKVANDSERTGLGGIDANLSALASGDVTITGSSGDNIFLLGSGNDTIDGGDGNDYLRGGDGDDYIVGGLGGDYLFGGDGDDILYGGSGGDGNDFISGGDGYDIAVFDYTNLDSEGNYYLDQGGERYTYSFQRTTSDQGTGVEVRVSMTNSNGETVYTDRVLDDVEAFQFGQQVKTIDDLVGSVINVNTGEKFATIQEAIDDADTIDGHEILVTPRTYDEEAFVDKDLTFFVQQNASGITLTLANQDDNPTIVEPNVRVLSQTDIIIKGNQGDNNIEILDVSDLTNWDASNVSTLETNSSLSAGDTQFDLIKHVDGGDGDILFGSITDFDGANYTIFGLGGDDTIAVSTESTKNHYLFGGSGDDNLVGGQGRDWLDGGSGSDNIYSHGGDDRILGGSDDDTIVLATRDDTAGAGNDGRVLVLLGGGDDTLLPGALDTAEGIDLNVFVGDFTKGKDKVSLEGLQDIQGGTADLSDLADLNLLSGSTIDLSAFAIADGDIDRDNDHDVEGGINLLGVNTLRLDATDFASAEGTGAWFDEYENLLGLSS